VAGWVSAPGGLNTGCSALALRCLDLQRQISTLREQIQHLQLVIRVQHHGLRAVIQEVRLARPSHRAGLCHRERDWEALGWGLLSGACVLGMGSLLIALSLVLHTLRSHSRTHFNIEGGMAPLRMG